MPSLIAKKRLVAARRSRLRSVRNSPRQFTVPRAIRSNESRTRSVANRSQVFAFVRSVAWVDEVCGFAVPRVVARLVECRGA
jgi:hypothetical protein